VNAPRVNRSKTMDLTRIGPDRYRLSGRLTDTSHHGNYGSAEATGQCGSQAVIHDFLVKGELAGPELIVTSLEVVAAVHPYRQCPNILPRCQALIGRSVARGWRSTLLETLGATAGCTHVTTLLLGLAEARTMAFFLQMNAETEYTAQTRDDGRWTATSLEVAPGVVGACHALVESGPVIRKAIDITLMARDDPPTGH
jgi:hypothetical protein